MEVFFGSILNFVPSGSLIQTADRHTARRTGGPPGCGAFAYGPFHTSVIACGANIYSSSASEYSKMSPGWQESALQMASSVEKRIALILPVFILERLTLDTPTFSDRSFRLILRSAMTRSRRRMIFPTAHLTAFHRIHAAASHRSGRCGTAQKAGLRSQQSRH